MKWKDFKEEVESKGIKDNDEIVWIDVSPFNDGLTSIAVNKKAGGGFSVYSEYDFSDAVKIKQFNKEKK